MKLPETWTLIAESQYTGVQGSGFSRWVSVPDAVLSVTDARGLHRDGKILMSQKRLPCGTMGLMVKAKAI
jgi:hypothetical protein